MAASCACGCSRAVGERLDAAGKPAIYASDRCRWRTDKRNARAGKLSPLELVRCVVCGQSFLRGRLARRRRYHPECKPTARKLLENERANVADKGRSGAV